ncbi:MAG: hypothetical protein P0Y49_12140 [Candidatus Pedobacter colombiensis]|uniref:Lipoprotein n=1 Tax=Candidatus Pedobacter colombiensis TaxID=3121371 RepID=A0AAJ5W5K2_9SPHI|nr:hypothetical protein [Pedobacter sp.]WEK17545.1 MAG: hypothetical protein P0Y49_12140 [Pedobacter sp.]
MKYFILLALCVCLLTNCSKQTSPPAKPVSKITVNKNDIAWESEGVYASYNVDEDIVHVMSGKDNESFEISFKKGNIPITGIMKDFSSGVLITPFKASAAISDSYSLDTTKPNKLKILIIDNPEKRIAGDFLLYLKRNEQHTAKEEINVFQGRFDVRYEPFSLK